MINHIVMWTLKDEADGRSKAENLLLMKQMLLDLIYEIDEIKSLDVGINCGDARFTNFDICLSATFDTPEDIEKYQQHPAHQKCVEFIRKVRNERAAIDFPDQD